MSSPPAGTSKATRQLVVFGGLFLVLTLAGIAWALRSSGLELGQVRRLGELPPATLVLTLALAVGVYLTEMLRFRVTAAAIEQPLSWLACWDASVANFFFAWLTPGSALAEPATIYVLHRRAYPVDAALVVCFGKSFTSFLILLTAALGLLALGIGPRLHPALLLPFAGGSAVLLALCLLVAVGAFWPERLTAWLRARRAGLVTRWPFRGPRGQRLVSAVADTVIKAVARASSFRALSLLGWLGILASHLLYFSVFVGTLLVLAAALGASSLAETAPAAVIYQAFTYVAPTPGGSGLSEATAEVFFGHALSAQAAVLAVLLFRTVTFYLHILLGLVYLPLLGGIRAMIARE